jgi:RNA polymerase sigma-70 factor (ECF subfamily)
MQPTATCERSDEELVDSFRRTGQTRDLDVLLGRYVGRLRRTIYAMVLNASDADDLTQEVFLRAIRGLPQFSGQSRFSTWLHRVALNTTRRFLRRRAGSPVVPAAVLPDPAGPASDQPEREAMQAEMNQQITAALAELSPPLRAAVALTVLEGISAQEAARIEDCSRATMYWRVHRARKILTQRLAKYLSP